MLNCPLYADTHGKLRIKATDKPEGLSVLRPENLVRVKNEMRYVLDILEVILAIRDCINHSRRRLAEASWGIKPVA